MALGRPTIYEPELCETLPDMFMQGESITEVCVKLGISRDTFYRWMKLYPDFSDAVKIGLEKSEAWWEKLGRAGAAGVTDINPPVWIFNMKNRFKWSDRSDVSVSGMLDTSDSKVDINDIVKKVKEQLGD